DKLDRCIVKINRDVVDAERQLRMGQGDAPPVEMPMESGVVGNVSGNLDVVGDARLSPEN
ncbi:MAG: hypothetical protein OXT74_01555, partial [Candidatus Poribacteria bacterium]|nr:hypothetical protein [Candidatus Poribacteria bacterium]